MLWWELKSHKAQENLSGHFGMKRTSQAVRRKTLNKETTHLFDGWQVIDHHHLLYPSKKYNQLDYKQYKFTKDEIKSVK